MNAQLVVVIICLFLVSCDPAYHLRYAVMNESDVPVYCIDRKGVWMKGVPTRIDPDSSVLVYEEAGYGKERIQFRDSRTEIAGRFILCTDSFCSDTALISPGKDWKLYYLPRGDFNARIYIRNSDLNK